MNMSKVDLQQLIEKAIIDCYDEYEQRACFYTMLEDNLEFPFEATVVGEKVKVTGVDQQTDELIVAVCKRKGKTYTIDLLSLNYDPKQVTGSEWIEAYREWSRGSK